MLDKPGRVWQTSRRAIRRGWHSIIGKVESQEKSDIPSPTKKVKKELAFHRILGYTVCMNGWGWSPPKAGESRMSKPMTKATLTSMKDFAKRLREDGYYDNHAKVLALIEEVERLQKLAKPNRAPKTRTVKVLHRYESWSDGRGGIEHGKRVEDAITCPAKDSGCPDCKPRRGSFYDMY